MGIDTYIVHFLNPKFSYLKIKDDISNQHPTTPFHTGTVHWVTPTLSDVQILSSLPHQGHYSSCF